MGSSLNILKRAEQYIMNLVFDEDSNALKVTNVEGTGGSQIARTLSLYGMNNIDDTTDASLQYIGTEDKDGTYCIKKYSTATKAMVYATILNNPSVTTYATAWAAHTSLTYDIYSIAF